MKKILLFLPLFFFLVGCTPVERYGDFLTNWSGATEERLVTAWGIPDKTYVISPTKKMISYKNRKVLRDGAPIQCTSPKNGPVTCSGGQTTTSVFSCETTFTIEKGYVVSWQYEGNNCRSVDHEDR